MLVPVDNTLYRLAWQLGVLDRDDVRVGRRPDAEGVRRRRRTSTKPVAVKTEVGYLKLGELEVAAIPGEIYPELVLGKVQDPADPGADFPDAPAEPAIYAQLKGKHRMLIGLANDELGLLHPEAAVGREGAVLLRAEEGAVRRGEQRRPGGRADHLRGVQGTWWRGSRAAGSP